MSRQRHANRHRALQAPRQLVDEAFLRGTQWKTMVNDSLVTDRPAPYFNSLRLTKSVGFASESSRTIIDWDLYGAITVES